MANQKVSPRQKMINMMYFVLLAMLAMNVTNEVLDSFESIRERLKISATQAENNNQGFISIMNAEIERQMEIEKKEDNKGLIDTLAIVQGMTNELMKSLDQHVLEMEKLAKYDPEKKEFTKKDELDENYVYWMGETEEANQRRGEGEAYDLRESLDQYARALTSIYNSQVRDSMQRNPLLRQDPKESSKDPGKRWEQYTFEGPVVANLATLEALRVDVLQQEKELLEVLNNRIAGKINIIVDSIVAISSPLAQIVPAGLPFETQLSVGMVSRQVKPNFSSPSGRVNVDEGGNTATLQVMANASNIPAGKAEGMQSYTANVYVPKPDGTFDTLQVRQSFKVTKPELQVYSLAVNNLYRNCGNGLNIDVPALGVHYDPVVTASNAQVTQANDSKKKFLIIPNGRSSVVSVSSRTQGRTLKIDDRKYNVISPPKPEIDFRVNRRSYVGGASVPKSSSFHVKLVPDAEFKRLLPRDARYRITKISIKLKDGLRPPRTLRTINVSNQNALEMISLPVPAEIRQARAGDRAFFVIEGVERINFRGGTEEVKLSERVRTLAVDLR
ncbi:MAG: GldM family protein [Bacteroidia bacterium]|nr:GldM family protein [Bacteroidia bacterium]